MESTSWPVVPELPRKRFRRPALGGPGRASPAPRRSTGRGARAPAGRGARARAGRAGRCRTGRRARPPASRSRAGASGVLGRRHPASGVLSGSAGVIPRSASAGRPKQRPSARPSA
ncbi:hypothetical protein DK427_08025 [Methylobacterium radiodurans]|uniref:Uncharacterized protein n=1 Tax=Methylobacterium radiodurans TaxID=2202828 RepID=A0A2U8VPZ3_9HYPH|nr:hypothetical protein DK427_08025 [Methylobacterium radiodurans]